MNILNVKFSMFLSKFLFFGIMNMARSFLSELRGTDTSIRIADELEYLAKRTRNIVQSYEQNFNQLVRRVVESALVKLKAL